MITITRETARRLRSILRRSVLGITYRGTIPPLLLRAEGTQLRAHYRYGPVAVEHIESGPFGPVSSIALPLDALADFEGRDGKPVAIEAAGPDRTMVRWEDRGIPQIREYEVTPLDDLEPFPEPPETWESGSQELLAALAQAAETGTSDSPRYALDCIQLRGTARKIVATDGHQLLIRSGCAFPWDGDVLIKGLPIFAARGLPREQPVQIARTDTHVVLRIGPWTIFSEIQRDARFPSVEDVIPDDAAVTTRIRIDPADAGFLAAALERLPGNDEPHSPATIELNGTLAIRARAADQSQITELVLNRSSYSGTSTRINTNRTYLSRALRLGFGAIGLSGVGTPVVCREQARIYAWQPLGGDAAIEPAESVIRIESSPTTHEVIPAHTGPETPRQVMSEPVRRHNHEPAVQATDNGHAGNETTGASLASLIQDAEALHATLSEARSSVARLISGLRRQRKQSKLLSETLKSLRQLKLTEVAE